MRADELTFKISFFISSRQDGKAWELIKKAFSRDSSKRNIIRIIMEACIQSQRGDFLENFLNKYSIKIEDVSTKVFSPLHRAVIMGHTDIVEILLKHGANPNGLTPGNTRILHIAIRCKKYDIIECLMKYGADPNLPDSNGNYPIHIAVRTNDPNIIRILAKYGARFDVYDRDGFRPIHIAASTGSIEVISALIESGDDINALSMNGLTPLDYALYQKTNSRQTVGLVNFIKQAGGKQSSQISSVT